jgi:hypothetical protein
MPAFAGMTGFFTLIGVIPAQAGIDHYASGGLRSQA